MVQGMNKKAMKVIFSSKTDLWETPQALFDELDKEFHFTLDAAANEDNRKCERYYSKEDNGLEHPWTTFSHKETVWCNPPYGRKVGQWLKKACNENEKYNQRIVMLLPAKTDTQWFHDYIYHNPRVEIRFIKGRVKFGGAKDGAPFPSMLCIFHEK